MVERIRDATVAEAIAAEAGTDATPELILSDLVTPVLLLQQRPPLASSGYFPGTVGVFSGKVALNTSHAGIFGSGFGRSVVRVNWAMIINNISSAHAFTLRRVDSPFVGFPSVRLVPGYINAGNASTGGVFSVTKADTVAPQGVLIAEFVVEANQVLKIDGPWILNDGILLLAHGTVDTRMRAAFGYEVWPAIRQQPPG